MEQSGGGGDGSDEGAGGVDLISALPDDVLIHILGRLPTAAATRTSVLKRRWRRVWALLPELRFPVAPEPHRLRAVLEAHEAALGFLLVETQGAAPDSVAAWLPAAARRVSGRLVFRNLAPERSAEDEAAGIGALKLPCFERATSVFLDLGFLLVHLLHAGVSARLSALCLVRVRFLPRWPVRLGDAVSTCGCPCLQRLVVHDTWGQEYLNIISESLLKLELKGLRGLLKLNVWAPALKDLNVQYCFFLDKNQPIAYITAPHLESFNWLDAYDPSSVQIDHIAEMEHLRWLGTLYFLVYGPDGSEHNHACLSLLRLFKVVGGLLLTLAYPPVIDNYIYLMESMTFVPDVTFLHLTVMANGHAFGASSFHVLRMCSGIRRLKLEFCVDPSLGPHKYHSGCNCGQQPNWETEELMLNRLQIVEITELTGSEHEVPFVRRLLNWVTTVKRVIVTFSYFVTKTMAKELHQVLRSFSRPEIWMEFYWYKDMIKVLYAPED